MSSDNEIIVYGGKIGVNSSGDLINATGATLIRGLGPKSTKFQDNLVASTNNWTDLNGNQINSVSKGTVSASTTVTGNYVGGTTGAGTNATVTYVGWMQTSGAAAAETITLATAAPNTTITLSASGTGTCMVAAL